MEVLLVVVLLGVVAAIAWPDYGQARRSEELDESARRLKTLVQMCRAQAMNEARVYRLTIYEDGSIRVRRQHDPILAPHEYFRFRDPWVRMDFLLEHVWIEALWALPDGPPPLLVEDDVLEFEEFDEEPLRVEDLDQPYVLDFEPDGMCNSLRWVLRDEDGKALMMTLDGRLGRVTMESYDSIEPEEVERPDAVELDEEDEEFEEDQPELEELST